MNDPDVRGRRLRGPFLHLTPSPGGITHHRAGKGVALLHWSRDGTLDGLLQRHDSDGCITVYVVPEARRRASGRRYWTSPGGPAGSTWPRRPSPPAARDS